MVAQIILYDTGMIWHGYKIQFYTNRIFIFRDTFVLGDNFIFSEIFTYKAIFIFSEIFTYRDIFIFNKTYIQRLYIQRQFYFR